jgi:hypothetical protein
MQTKIVVVSLEEIIERDSEEFVALLEELWMADYDEEHRGILSTITYHACGFSAISEGIRIAVSADEEFPGEEERV